MYCQRCGLIKKSPRLFNAARARFIGSSRSRSTFWTTAEVKERRRHIVLLFLSAGKIFDSGEDPS